MPNVYRNLIYHIIISYLCVMICSENIKVTFSGNMKNGKCYEPFFRDDIGNKMNEWNSPLWAKVTQITYASLRLRLPKRNVCTAAFHPNVYYSSVVSFSAKVKVKLHKNLQINIPFMIKQLNKIVKNQNATSLKKHYESEHN
ncbi:unnamed protein product [Schistosoma rodhaini]|uniref:Uncharacterized protein n=1 Tax=Schistosoma rodhaini TaxID=6188 RepID=A0AA85G323_9TREM|nr:unnamed protein product [Schistosoma rodhaini]